jgi:hypothetical protein
MPEVYIEPLPGLNPKQRLRHLQAEYRRINRHRHEVLSRLNTQLLELSDRIADMRAHVADMQETARPSGERCDDCPMNPVCVHLIGLDGS